MRKNFAKGRWTNINIIFSYEMLYNVLEFLIIFDVLY